MFEAGRPTVAATSDSNNNFIEHDAMVILEKNASLFATGGSSSTEDETFELHGRPSITQRNSGDSSDPLFHISTRIHPPMTKPLSALNLTVDVNTRRNKFRDVLRSAYSSELPQVGTEKKPSFGWFGGLFICGANENAVIIPI